MLFRAKGNVFNSSVCAEECTHKSWTQMVVSSFASDHLMQSLLQYRRLSILLSLHNNSSNVTGWLALRSYGLFLAFQDWKLGAHKNGRFSDGITMNIHFISIAATLFRSAQLTQISRTSSNKLGYFAGGIKRCFALLRTDPNWDFLRETPFSIYEVPAIS